jgi:hypothetical protein
MPADLTLPSEELKSAYTLIARTRLEDNYAGLEEAAAKSPIMAKLLGAAKKPSINALVPISVGWNFFPGMFKPYNVEFNSLPFYIGSARLEIAGGISSRVPLFSPLNNVYLNGYIPDAAALTSGPIYITLDISATGIIMDLTTSTTPQQHGSLTGPGRPIPEVYGSGSATCFFL